MTWRHEQPGTITEWAVEHTYGDGEKRYFSYEQDEDEARRAAEIANLERQRHQLPEDTGDHRNRLPRGVPAGHLLGLGDAVMVPTSVQRSRTMQDSARGGPVLSEWERIQAAQDETKLCTSQTCQHPVYRHYSGAAGITRLCSLCGCTNWSKPAP